MQTEIKPYCTTGNQEHDQHKSNFVRLFSQMFFDSIKQDEDYQRVCQISEKLKTKSSEFLVNALKSSMSFDFISRHEDQFQVFLKFKLNKIKDCFANGMDNVVVAEARRKPDGSRPLRLISEMNEISGDLAWSFMLNTKTNIISFIKPQIGRRSDANKRLSQIVMENLNKLETQTVAEKEVFCNDE